MNIQVVKCSVDLLMGIMLLMSFVTGILKFTVLMRMLGLTGAVFPLAFLSDVHDWTGLALGILVAVHLFLNRGWIASVTKKILTGAYGSAQTW